MLGMLINRPQAASQDRNELNDIVAASHHASSTCSSHDKAGHRLQQQPTSYHRSA